MRTATSDELHNVGGCAHGPRAERRPSAYQPSNQFETHTRGFGSVAIVGWLLAETGLR